MWKFIAITAIFYQLSAYAAVIEPTQEVTLNCVRDAADEYLAFFDCSLIEVKSPKDKVVVTSSDFDINQIESHIRVTRLEISGNVNYPEYFPKNLAKNVNGIMNLFYIKTLLKFISRDDFKDMGSKLSMLSLKSNEIEDIPFDAFYDLPNLKYLDVSRNKLKELHPNLFTNSPLFDTLFATFNELTKFPADLFKDCPDFFVLYAEFNKIEELQENLFINNPNMTVISMRHNKVKNVPFDFNRFELLEVADFTHNGGSCDTMFFNFPPYDEWYSEEEQKKWIQTVPEFQKKIEETCRD